jgi:hypothetical protein
MILVSLIILLVVLLRSLVPGILFLLWGSRWKACYQIISKIKLIECICLRLSFSCTLLLPRTMVSTCSLWLGLSLRHIKVRPKQLFHLVDCGVLRGSEVTLTITSIKLGCLSLAIKVNCIGGTKSILHLSKET